MATIEVHAENKISIYELSDRGNGIDIEVARDTDGNYGVWAGPRGTTSGRCLGDAPNGVVLDGGDIAAAMTEVGEAEGWQLVKVNGSIVWSSEAVEAVKNALDDGESESEDE